MTRGLTEKQRQILQYISRTIREQGFPPTIREIGDHFGIKSLRGVTVHLDALQHKKYITRESKSRSIRLTHPEFQVDSTEGVRMLPLLGTIAAGAPIVADQNVESYIPVPAEMVRGDADTFLLRVRGDSMLGDHIRDNDLVMIHAQNTVGPQDIAAVMVNDEATIKRLEFAGDIIRLIPTNPQYDVIEVPRDEATVIGRVVGLLRSYDRRLS